MTELFELELVGGDVERRYRTARPEVEAMPWGTMDPSAYAPELVEAARKAWTGAAFQEFRTSAACAATLEAMLRARAPIDLIAVATRFPLDELVHVELCSRMAMELGGAIPWLYDPADMLARFDDGDPLLRASKLVITYFCVGEAASIPLLHGTAEASTHPLPRAILRRIVRDEADHGTFGWTWLDWALPLHSADEITALGATADAAIRSLQAGWADVAARRAPDEAAIHDLGWLGTDDYLARAARALERQVRAPLLARGIPLS